MKYITTCNKAIDSNTMKSVDWGFNFLVDTEIDALRIAYAYRNTKHGVKMEYANGAQQWMVTVFNAVGAACKLDGAK